MRFLAFFVVDLKQGLFLSYAGWWLAAEKAGGLSRYIVFSKQNCVALKSGWACLLLSASKALVTERTPRPIHCILQHKTALIHVRIGRSIVFFHTGLVRSKLIHCILQHKTAPIQADPRHGSADPLVFSTRAVSDPSRSALIRGRFIRRR